MFDFIVRGGVKQYGVTDNKMAPFDVVTIAQ